MKRQICMGLCFVLLLTVLTLAGCASKEEKRLRGVWEAEADIVPLVIASLEEEEDVMEHFQFGELKVKLTVRFSDDGTYTVTPDADSVGEITVRLRSAIRKGLESYMSDVVDGLGGSLDDLLATTGLVMDQLVNNAIRDAGLDSLDEMLKKDGKYRIGDGKLWMSVGDAALIEEAGYEQYTFADDTHLTLTGHTDGGKGLFDGMYPVVMQKLAS